MTQPSTEPLNRTRHFARKLSAYTAAAVGVLSAGDHQVQGGIIYTDLGREGIQVPLAGFELDLNRDAAADFLMTQTSTTFTSGTSSYKQRIRRTSAMRAAEGIIEGGVLLDDRGVNAHAFLVHSEIVPGGPTRGSAELTHYFRNGNDSSSTTGPFTFFPCDSSHCGLAYVGLSFQFNPIQPAYHAGWALVDATQAYGRIYGFAYETEPGKSIIAGAVPEPPSLLLLASGAAGLAGLRRKKQAVRGE